MEDKIRECDQYYSTMYQDRNRVNNESDASATGGFNQYGCSDCDGKNTDCPIYSTHIPMSFFISLLNLNQTK